MNTTHRTNFGNKAFSGNSHSASAPVQEYVEPGDVQAKPWRLNSNLAKTGVIIGALLVGTAAGAPFNSEDSPNETAVVESENTAEELDLEGLSAEEASNELGDAGISDITIDHSDVEHGDGVVSGVDISNEEAYITLEDHTADVISSLELEDMRWNEAEAELTSAGFINHEDYVVYTDSGDMVYERNWAVDYIDATDDGMARIVVTNEGMENLRDGVAEIGESAQQGIDSLLGENSEEAEDDE